MKIHTYSLVIETALQGFAKAWSSFPSVGHRETREREREREREIKFIGLFENRGHPGPYSPYKPFNHNLNIGIIIFPHIDNPQYTGYD